AVSWPVSRYLSDATDSGSPLAEPEAPARLLDVKTGRSYVGHDLAGAVLQRARPARDPAELEALRVDLDSNRESEGPYSPLDALPATELRVVWRSPASSSAAAWCGIASALEAPGTLYAAASG